MSRKFETTLSKQHNQQQKYKKFIGNKSEGQGFADRRKKKVQYEYLKMLKKEERLSGGGRQPKSQQQFSPDRTDERQYTPDPGSSNKHNMKHKDKWKKEETRVNRYTKLTDEVKDRKQIKQLKKEEVLNRKRESGEALEKYKERKKGRFKKLCKKTHRGQPVMKNQIEYLLDKIEKQVTQT